MWSRIPRTLVKGAVSIQSTPLRLVMEQRSVIADKVNKNNKIMYDLTLYTYLSPSKVCGGVGVFSLCDIPKGTMIWKGRQPAQKITWNKIPIHMQQHIASMTWCDEDGFWIDCDLDRIYQAYYVNHSDDPNVGIDDDELYVAIKDIKKDEELLYRYSKIEQTWT